MKTPGEAKSFATATLVGLAGRDKVPTMIESEFVVRNSKRIGYFCGGICAALYFYLTTRYAMWNFDDLYYYGYRGRGWDGLQELFLGLDITNEYRTYSFSRSLQFVLLKMFGNTPFVFHALMSITHLASGLLVYLIFKGFTNTPSLFSPEGFGCSLIWIFSPFSIVGTFHHFSYLLLPFFALLAYIYIIELRAKNNAFMKDALSSILLVAICLSGESTLPALLGYQAVKLYNRPRSTFFALQIVIAASTLVLHYVALEYFNQYSSRQTRFAFDVVGVDLLENLAYFFASVGSSISQGMHLTATSFEPYYPGLTVYSFALENLSGTFFLATSFLLMLVLFTYRMFNCSSKDWQDHSRGTRSDFMDDRSLVAMAFFVLSLWGMYLAMSASGTKLYGRPFALQIRYGYVVLPMSLCLLFIAWRRLTSASLIRGGSWVIPCVSVVCWFASQIVVAPLNEAQNSRIISLLNDAYDSGVRIIRIEHRNASGAATQTRPFGITNPFIRLGDSPFQQDWTTEAYLSKFMGLTLYHKPLVDRDSQYFSTQEESPALIEKKAVASIGAESVGLIPINYRPDDVRIRYSSHRQPHR